MKRPTTIRLSDEARRALVILAQRHDRSMASMIERLVQEKAKQEGVWAPRPLKAAK